MTWPLSPQEEAELDRAADGIDYEHAQERRDGQSHRDDANLGDQNRSAS